MVLKLYSSIAKIQGLENSFYKKLIEIGMGEQYPLQLQLLVGSIKMSAALVIDSATQGKKS